MPESILPVRDYEFGYRKKVKGTIDKAVTIFFGRTVNLGSWS
jgi:hypothetical protein